MIGIGHYPSVENLQCFVSAADHLNFSRAAQELAITPTAFGQRIKQLEEQLDAELFHRTTRRVELTEAGLRLLPQAQQLLDMAGACRTSVHDDSQLPASFTLGTRFELGMSWLMPSIIELSVLRPHWTIQTYFGSGPDILQQLSNGRVDAVITSAPVANADWDAEFLHREDYVFTASASLLEAKPFRKPQDARFHTLFDVDRELPLTRYLTSAVPDMEFAEVRFCGAGAAILEFVRSGQGVAVLPEYMIKDELADGEFVRLLPHVPLLHDSFRLLFRRASPHAQSIRQLAGFLRERPLT